jgi:hypothetical protein
VSEDQARVHENADKAARRRALKTLREIETQVGILRQRISDERAEPDGDDTQRIASLVRDLTQHHAVLGALRDVREWHAADQAEESGLPVMPGVRSYSGPRLCLYCQKRARHDVSGFLACNDPEHIARALEDLTTRRAQEDAHDEGVAAELNAADQAEGR